MPHGRVVRDDCGSAGEAPAWPAREEGIVMRAAVSTRMGVTPMLLLGLVLLVAACADEGADDAAEGASGDDQEEASEDGSEDAEPDDDGSDDEGEETAEADLQEVCGDEVVIQTDWMPQTWHGAAYQLAGPDGEFDPEAGIYRGEIDGTGVTAEIRSGGPFIGFQGMASTMYQDPDILLGQVVTDEAVRFSGRLPTVHVVAPTLRTPQILFWNPEVYDFEEFADIGESDATVLYFEGASYMDYLVGEGWIREEQTDSSYDGTPARFIAEGDLVQQGFVTSEPYNYENEYEEWDKPVDFLLIDDAGFEIYPQALSVRADALEEEADCLEVLVPMIQQAQIDYMEDPGPVSDKIMEIANEVDYSTTEGLIDHSLQAMEEYDLVGNGHNDTLGDFDMDRVQDVVDLLGPIYEEKGEDAWNPDVTAEDIATNEFIDPDIGMD